MSEPITGRPPSVFTRHQSFCPASGGRSPPSNLHGEVGLTMAKVRNRYWIPKLRKLVKKVRRNCHRWKRFQEMAYNAPPPGYLLTTRTEGVNPFQVIVIDISSPLQYRISSKKNERLMSCYMLVDSQEGFTWISYHTWKPRVPEKHGDVYRSARKTGANLFRQRQVVCRCCEADQGSDEGQVTSELPVS